MNKRLIAPLIGLSLMLAGILVALPAFLRSHESSSAPKVTHSPFTAQTATAATVPAPTAASTPTTTAPKGEPVRLQIPSLHMDLQVVEGFYNAKRQTWTLSNDKAHYAVVTALPNDKAGNTFIYGHYRREVFASLHKIKLGAEVLLTTDKGQTFVYTFMGALETTPTDNSLFAYQGDPILTIQTCSGVLFQNRQLFTFALKEVRS